MAKRKHISGQQQVVKNNLSTIIGSASFQLGFESARNGKGWPSSYDKLDPRSQWRFERGRMLGIIAPHVTLKHGRSTTREAINAYLAAQQAKELL